MKRKKKAKKRHPDACDCREVKHHFEFATGGKIPEWDDSGFIFPDGTFGVLPGHLVHEEFIDDALGHGECYLDDYKEKCGSLYFRWWEPGGGLILDSHDKPNREQVDALLEFFDPGLHTLMTLYCKDDEKRVEHPRPLDIQSWISRCWG